jgi:hypothetical protein
MPGNVHLQVASSSARTTKPPRFTRFSVLFPSILGGRQNITIGDIPKTKVPTV